MLLHPQHPVCPPGKRPESPAHPSLAVFPVRPVERQRLLHGRDQHGGSPGPVLPVQLQPGPLRGDARQVQAALHPGHVSVRVLAQPGALDPAGQGALGWALRAGEQAGLVHVLTAPSSGGSQ